MISYFEKQLSEFQHSIRSLNESEFNRLVDETVHTLQAGHKIIVTGLGKNVPICDKFVGSMISMGLDASFLHTNSAVHGDMGIVKPGDILIILTKSGETEESVYLARLIQKRGAYMWLLSFEKDSTLAQIIPDQLILGLEHEGDLWNVMPNNSTTLNLVILQTLAMHVAEEMCVTLENFRQNHPGGHIGELLK